MDIYPGLRRSEYGGWLFFSWCWWERAACYRWWCCVRNLNSSPHITAHTTAPIVTISGKHRMLGNTLPSLVVGRKKRKRGMSFSGTRERKRKTSTEIAYGYRIEFNCKRYWVGRSVQNRLTFFFHNEVDTPTEGGGLPGGEASVQRKYICWNATNIL